MLVTLHGDAKEARSKLEGHYILQTDPVNKKPWWFNERETAIWWYKEGGKWFIGAKGDLGDWGTNGIFSEDDVEDPLQALTWEYYNGGFIKSKDILVTRTGNL